MEHKKTFPCLLLTAAQHYISKNLHPSFHRPCTKIVEDMKMYKMKEYFSTSKCSETWLILKQFVNWVTQERDGNLLVDWPLCDTTRKALKWCNKPPAHPQCSGHEPREYRTSQQCWEPSKSSDTTRVAEVNLKARKNKGLIPLFHTSNLFPMRRLFNKYSHWKIIVWEREPFM